MSWISDGLANVGRGSWGVLRDYANFANNLSGNPVARNVYNFASGQYDRQQLRGTQVESILSGFPVLGNFIQGISGVQQLEDLYDRTGKTSAYASNLAAGIGKGIGKIGGKIEKGVNDLYEYYSGEKDPTATSSNPYSNYSYDQLINLMRQNGELLYGDEL